MIHCIIPFKNFGQIHLDKKVPTGAGLGGGSSNAATALWAANQFNGCLATEKELQEWSSEIGSDVPFFFSQGAAYCTGRGEVCLRFTKMQFAVHKLVLFPSTFLSSSVIVIFLNMYKNTLGYVQKPINVYAQKQRY